MQVSDLHNASFGEGNAELLERVKQASRTASPSRGDLVDSRHTDVETALSFAREAAKIAPSYYVTGNHEARLEDWEQLLTGLEEAGVTILQNEVPFCWNGKGSRLSFPAWKIPAFMTITRFTIRKGYGNGTWKAFLRRKDGIPSSCPIARNTLPSMKSWGST